MRYIRYAFLAGLAICLVTIAMANRGLVTLQLLPDEIAGFVNLPNTIKLPLFIVIFGGIVGGLLIGFVWEWFREHKIRAQASKSRRNVKELEREVVRLKGEKNDQQDDVLALLETTG